MVWWMMNPMMAPYMAAMNTMQTAQAPSSSGTSGAPMSEAVTPRNDLLQKHGTQACCMWSEADGFYQFSDNWTAITGLMAADCMGNGWQEVMHEDSLAEWNQSIEDLFSPDPNDQVPAISLECKMARGDGYWGWHRLTLVPMQMGDRRAVSILVCDLSEQKELQQVADYATRETELAQQGRASFLSNMSHELRTPLNAVLGFAQMLQTNEHMERDDALSYLQHIRESGEDLLTKINDLIELANIDQHSAKVHEEAMNLSDIITAAVEMHSHAAFSRDITIAQNIEHSQLVLRGDRTKLIHIISHLLCNAIAHSDNGSSIRLCCNANDSDGIRLSVEDRGCGIKKEVLDNINNTLTCSKSYYQTDISNIGLGLSVAKEFTELHGGALKIESVNGQGTIANIRIPAERIVSLSAKVKLKKLEST